jgi:hypothetical protein
MRPRTTFLNELGLITVSLLLALLIWVAAQDEKFERKTIRLGVRPISVPENVEFEFLTRPELLVSLPVRQIDQVNDFDFEVHVDLGDLARRAGLEGPDEFDIPLYLRDVQATPALRVAPRDVVPEDIIPRQLTVRAQLIAAAFELRADLQGEPVEGHHVEGQPDVSPYQIWLSGPRESLDRAASGEITLLTDPINLGGRTQDQYTFSPGLRMPEGVSIVGYRRTEISALVRIQDGSPPETLAVLSIAEDTVEREIAGCGGILPILRVDLRVAKQNPEHFTVVVEGPASLVESLRVQDIEVRAPALLDIDQPREENIVRVQARLAASLPEQILESVRVVSVKPSEATVTIEDVAPADDEAETTGLPGPPPEGP